MSDTFFFAFPEDAALAFGRRSRMTLVNRDVKAWSQLLEGLGALRRPPYVSLDGRLSVDAHPLTDFEWHLPPERERPELSQESLPGPESEELQCLLMYGLLMATEPKMTITWPKFCFGWTITVADERIVQPGPEQEEFDLLARSFFEHPRNAPDDLWFLQAASYLHAYASTAQVAAMAECERRTGLLARLGNHYEAISEPITQSFGRAIGMLRHFLALAHAERKAVFMCYRAL